LNYAIINLLDMTSLVMFVWIVASFSGMLILFKRNLNKKIYICFIDCVESAFDKIKTKR